MTELVAHLAWPIGLALLIGLVSGAAFRPRPGRAILGPLACGSLAAAALLAGLGLLLGRDGLRLEIGVLLAAAYALACLAASLLRRLVSRG